MALVHWQRTFTDEAGNIRPNLQVEIRDEASGALAAIYSDVNGTNAKANPFVTGSDGYANFYAAPGEYRIQADNVDWRHVPLVASNLTGTTVDNATGLKQPLVEALSDRWIRLNTKADLVAAVYLEVGDRVRLADYASSGGGGGGDYEIVPGGTGTANGGSYIDLNNGLQAKALFGLEVDVKRFGGVADGVADDTAAAAARDYAASSGRSLFFPDGEWTFSSPIDISGVHVRSGLNARFHNDSGTPFLMNGVNVGSLDTTSSASDSNVSSVTSRNMVVRSVNSGASASSYTDNDLTGQSTSIYWNGERNGSTAGGRGHFTYYEYGRQVPASGSGGVYQGNYQVYDALPTTPAGTTSELTPLAIGINFRNIDPTTGDPVTNNGPLNIYNDFVVHGPIASSMANREKFLAGLSIAALKYAPGNVVGADGRRGGYGLSVVTTPLCGGFGGGQDKTGVNTHPLRAGIHINGFSGERGQGFAGGGHNANAGFGFDSGILIGDQAIGVWDSDPQNSRGKFFDGMRIRDYVHSAIDIREPHPDKDAAPAIAVASGAGEVSVGDPIRPGTDGGTTSGTSAMRWDTVHSINGVSTTSDGREKTDVLPLDAAEEAVATELRRRLKKFRWKADVEERGDEAVWHFGIIAQEVVEVFESHGLDAHKYGMIRHETWDEQPEVRNKDDGGVIQKWKPAGDRYGVNYSELLAFIISAM